MREFEVTLNAVSRKKFSLQADSQDEAMLLVTSILENSSLLSFSDEDVCSLDVSCEEQCGGACEICENTCEECGSCSKTAPGCDHPKEDCEYRCLSCGCCTMKDDDNEEG